MRLRWTAESDMVEGGSVTGERIKDTCCPSQGQHYVEKVNKL